MICIHTFTWVSIQGVQHQRSQREEEDKAEDTFIPSIHCKHSRPLLCSRDSILLIRLPMVSHIIGKRIIGIGSREQCLNTQQHCSYLQCRTPLLPQDIQAYSSQLINIGMIYLGEETGLGRSHGVLGGEEQFKLVDTSFIGWASRTCNDHWEVPQVVFMRSNTDPWCWFLGESLGLLQNPGGYGHDEEGWCWWSDEEEVRRGDVDGEDKVMERKERWWSDTCMLVSK